MALGGAATLGDLVFGLKSKDVSLKKGVATGKKDVGSLKKAGVTAAKAIGAAFTVAGVAIIAAFAKSLKNALSFQEGLKKVETLGVANIEALSDALKEFAIESGQDAIQMTEDLYNVLSAGIPEDAAIMVLEKAYLGAAAGAGSLSAALEGGTSLMNAYGLATGDADEIVRNFEEIMGIMAVTIKNGKTNMDELGVAIGKKAGIMKAAGVPLKEYLAMIGALTTTGLSAAEAVTGLSAAVSAIMAPMGESKAVANLLGLEFSATALKGEGAIAMFQKIADRVKQMNPELVENMQNIKNVAVALEEERIGLVSKADALFEIEKRTPAQVQALKDVQKALKGNAKAAKKNKEGLSDLRIIGDDAEGTMKKLFGSVEGLNVVLGLTGPLAGNVAKSMEDMVDAVTTLDIMSRKYMDGNLTKKLNEQRVSFQVLSLELGEELLPIFAELLMLTKPLLEGVIKWIKTSPESFKAVTIITGALGFLMAVLGPLLFTFNNLLTFFTKIKPLLKFIFPGWKAAFAGIGSVSGALNVLMVRLLIIWGAGKIGWQVGRWLDMMLKKWGRMKEIIEDTYNWFSKYYDLLLIWLELRDKPAGPGANLAAERAALQADIARGDIVIPAANQGGMAAAAAGASASSVNAGGSAGATININMGGVTISNGMDLGIVNASIGASVESALRRRGVSLRSA